MDDCIVYIFTEHKFSELRYNLLEKEMNLRHRVSTATLSSHLKKLYGREILCIRVKKNGHTYYSLTKRFRDRLEYEMKHAQPPINRYLRNTFSRFDCTKRYFYKGMTNIALKE